MKLRNLVSETTHNASIPSLRFDGRYYDYARLVDKRDEFPHVLKDLVIENYPQLVSLNEIGDIEEVENHLQIRNCSHFTDLSSLPVRIGGQLSISDCYGLVSLHGINSRLKHAGQISIHSHDNKVKTRVLGLLMIQVDKPFYFGTGYYGDDVLRIVEGILNRYRNGGRSGVLAAQRDLIAEGLEDCAKM